MYDYYKKNIRKVVQRVGLGHRDEFVVGSLEQDIIIPLREKFWHAEKLPDHIMLRHRVWGKVEPIYPIDGEIITI